MPHTFIHLTAKKFNVGVFTKSSKQIFWLRIQNESQLQEAGMIIVSAVSVDKLY